LEHWDSVFCGLEFVLARNPELFHKIRNGPLRLAVVNCYMDLPEVHVIFAYDDQSVYLLDAYLEDCSGEE